MPLAQAIQREEEPKKGRILGPGERFGSPQVTLDASGYLYYTSQYTPFLFKSV